MGNVLSKCGVINIDKITCTTNFRMSELYTEKIFRRKNHQLVAVTLKYYQKLKLCAESFTIMPTDILMLNSFDLTHTDTIKNIVLKTVYDNANTAKYSIRIIKDQKKVMMNQKQ